mgnify:FL=1
MRKILQRMDKPILLISIIMFAFGLIMVLSASSMESYMRYGFSPYHYFIRQAIFLGVGIIPFIFIIVFPTNKYRHLINIAMFGIIGVLFGLTVWGTVAKNAQSWFSIGPFNIQPSELAKIIIIMFLAIYYDKHKDELDNQWILIKPLILCIIIFLLVAIQPDLGTAGIIALLTIIMFYGVPMTKKTRNIYNKIFLGGILVILSILLVTGGSFLRGYQAERLNFKDPCERYQEDSGYQLCNSFIAFKNGGLTGQGIGESTQKYLYLPESYTDFIFPIIVEECGLIVGIIILIMYMILLYRIIRIAKKATNIHNSLISYGIFAYIFLHILVNLGGVMGLIPLTGVPLPYLSYGGSYTICLMVAIALVERVAIETNIKKEKSAKK